SRVRDTRPPLEGQDSVRQDRDLQALLGLNPGPAEGPVTELLRQDGIWRELRLWKVHCPTSLVPGVAYRNYRAVPQRAEAEDMKDHVPIVRHPCRSVGRGRACRAGTWSFGSS